MTAEYLTRDRDATVTIDEDLVFGKIDDRVPVFESDVGQGESISRCRLRLDKRKRK
jgi:hypothetical protein